mgnify:FL=1
MLRPEVPEEVQAKATTKMTGFLPPLLYHTQKKPSCDISHKAGDFVLGQGRGTESSPRDGTCALFHFFEVHIFTLVFGEDLFLLPSGVGFRGTAAGVLASSVLLFACIKIGSRLLVGTVGHVKAIREANSEERQDEIQNASESNAKEDNKSYHKGEKTSESGVHTVEVWGDGSKKEDAEKTFGRSLQESSPTCRVFGCFSLREEMPT